MINQRDNKGRFEKGISGNPKGRPRKNLVPKCVTAKSGIVSSNRDRNGRFAKGTPGYSGDGDKVYIAWCEGDYYKIGICKDARSRMAMMQSNCPYKVELIYLRKVENASEIELSLKELFSEKRVRGEWYLFDKSDVEYIQMYIEGFSLPLVAVYQPQIEFSV